MIFKSLNGIRYYSILCIVIVVFLYSKATASNYYISNTGNDNNVGTSPAFAWATISKINNTVLSPGDSVLFQAGDTWREILLISQSGVENNWIVYTRFGTGSNPEILGSELATDWVETGTPNVWVCNSSLIDYSTYAQPPLYFSSPGRMFLKDQNGITWANYREYDAGFSNLNEALDYTTNVNTNLHYLYAETDPDELFDAVEVTQRDWCIRMLDNEPENFIEINGINMMFGREEGFFTGYPAQGDPHDLVFRNCSIQYIGLRGGSHAYGATVWHSNLLIENCLFSDAGRRAVSYNLYQLGFPVGMERKRDNIILRNNIFKRGWHTTSLDLSANDRDGDTITNVFFYNNIIDDSELIDSIDKITSSVPSRTSQQLYINTEGNDNINKVYVYNNLFIHATARAINIFNDDTIHIWNNTIVGHNKTLLYKNPDGSISSGEGDRMNLDISNNIIHDNLPDNSYWNAAIHAYLWNVDYFQRDYNLYSCLYPGNINRLIASLYDGSDQNYFTYGEWESYRNTTLYDMHSPDPAYAEFVDENNFDFQLTELSPAIQTGQPVFKTLVDPFGVIDTIGKYDLNGIERSTTKPSIGAYEYREIIPDNLNINSQTFDQEANECFGANQSIVVAEDGNPVIFESGSSVTLIAGHSVRILPETHIEYGASLNAYISEDHSFCESNQQSIVNVYPINKKSSEQEKPLFENSEENNHQHIKAYPTVNDGVFTLEINGFNANVNVVIYNALGTLVESFRQCEKQIRVNISDCPKGMYFIKIQNSDSPIINRILIK